MLFQPYHINNEFNDKITDIKTDNPHDKLVMSGSKAEWREVLSSLGGGLALLRPFFLSLSWNCFHTIYHTQNKRPYATYAKTYAKWNNRNKRNGLSSTEIVSLWLLTDVGFMVEFWQFF